MRVIVWWPFVCVAQWSVEGIVGLMNNNVAWNTTNNIVGNIVELFEVKKLFAFQAHAIHNLASVE